MKIEDAIEGMERIINHLKEKKKDDGDRGYLLGLEVGIVYLYIVQKYLIEPPKLTYEQEYELKEQFKDKYIEKSVVSSYISGMLNRSADTMWSEVDKKISEYKIS